MTSKFSQKEIHALIIKKNSAAVIQIKSDIIVIHVYRYLNNLQDFNSIMVLTNFLFFREEVLEELVLMYKYHNDQTPQKKKTQILKKVSYNLLCITDFLPLQHQNRWPLTCSPFCQNNGTGSDIIDIRQCVSCGSIINQLSYPLLPAGIILI